VALSQDARQRIFGADPGEDHMITRRSALTVAAAAGIAPAAAAELDLSTPADKVLAFARLRGRADGKPNFMAYRATIFAMVEGHPGIPVFDVEGCAWSRIERIDDTHYAFGNVEAGYYLDRATGQPLDIWRNPINGLDCKVEHYRSFQYYTLTPDAVLPKTERPVGTEYRGVLPPITRIGDQVWMHEDLFVRAPNRPKESFADPLGYTGPFVTATSLATWTAKLADLISPKLAFVPATLSFQTANSWRPFMRLGTTPGFFSWRMMGVKLPSRDGIPAALQARVLKDYPDFFERL
jgi:hypothetical protein